MTTATATAPAPVAPDMKTFRGDSLEELLPRIRQELGADAVVLRQRDGLTGGVAGFFQRRCVEVDARAGGRRVDTYADGSEAEARAALLGEEIDEEGLEDGLAEHEREERFSLPSEPPVEECTDPALAEGLEAPAIRALFEAAAPFADRLMEAEASLSLEAEAPLPVVAEARLPAVAGTLGTELAAPAGSRRPVAADAQEAALVAAGLSPSVAAGVVAETVSHLLPFGSPRGLKRLVRMALARRIRVHGPGALGGGPIAFAGAGGSGKSLTTARLAAAYAARSDLPVSVVALRPRDGGAGLRALLEPAGVEVAVAATATDAESLVADAGETALVLVDTPAVSPGDAEAVKALARDLRRMKVAEVHVCAPATLSAGAARGLFEACAPLRPSAMVLTHADETPQVGAVVELAMAGGPPLSFVARDAELDSGLAVAEPAAVAALVLP